ncbi:MAG: hypothetical protein GXP49_04120 [Deltaproteobacteria bacterium]|nr:hypothetical protein [Deltaproteobacteria bacterium]
MNLVLTGISTALVVGLASAIVNADRREVGQVIFSPPVVSAPLLGLVLGNSLIGLQVGAVFGLLWIGKQGCGTRKAPNDSLAAMACVGASVISGASAAAVGASMLLSVPLARIGGMLDLRRERKNIDLGEIVYNAEGSEWNGILAKTLARGVFRSAVEGLIFGTIATLMIGTIVSLVCKFVPPSLNQSFKDIPALLPACAAGCALAAMPGKSPAVVFIIAALCLALYSFLWGFV